MSWQKKEKEVKVKSVISTSGYRQTDNYRKRISQERIELMQTASKEVIISLLMQAG